MADKSLSDLTDPRFLIAANRDVMSYVRRVNSSAHTDLGSVLLALGKALPGAHAYSPSYARCAYVVLHTSSNRIFALAAGMRRLAFRVPADALAVALADGGLLSTDIGSQWVSFRPWNEEGVVAANERVRRWCDLAFADAEAASE